MRRRDSVEGVAGLRAERLVAVVGDEQAVVNDIVGEARERVEAVGDDGGSAAVDAHHRLRRTAEAGTDADEERAAHHDDVALREIRESDLGDGVARRADRVRARRCDPEPDRDHHTKARHLPRLHSHLHSPRLGNP